MTDRDGQFQRCWDCGARRKVARLGTGPWDKNGPWFMEVKAPTRPEPTRQELLHDLFKQT